MTPIAIVEAVATVFWVYSGVAAIEWVYRFFQRDSSVHVQTAFELVGHLVPTMIMLVLVVLAGAMLGFPTVVVVIAILFPAGLAFGFHMALNDLRDTTWRFEALRLALVLGMAAAIIWLRQLS